MAEATIKDLYIEGSRISDFALSDPSIIIKRFEFTLLSTGGTPFANLTDPRVRFSARTSYTATSELVVIEEDDMTIDSVNATILVPFTSGNLISVEYNFKELELVYDFDIIDDTSVFHRICKGKLTIGGDA